MSINSLQKHPAQWWMKESNLFSSERGWSTEPYGVVFPLWSLTMKIKRTALSYLYNIVSLIWKSHLLFLQSTKWLSPFCTSCVLLWNLLFVVHSTQDVRTWLRRVILSTNPSRIQNKTPDSKEGLRQSFKVRDIFFLKTRRYPNSP